MAYRAIRWNELSLRNKLTLVIVALLTFGIVVAGIGTTLMLRPTLVAQLDSQLSAVAADPVSVIGGDPTTQRFTYDNVRQAPQPYYVAIVDDSGQVLVDNWGTKPRAVAPSLAPLERLLAAGQPNEAPNYSMFDMSDGLGTSWRSVVVGQGDYASDQVTGTLVIGLPLATVNSTMAAFLAIFFGFGLTVVIFGAALTRLLVSATLQPLRSVESTAMSFAAGDYAQRLTESTPNTEVGRLSRSLNMMLGRIDEALDERQATIGRMRRFIGDASHELRTPLVTVRGYAELYRMGALDDPSKVGQAMDRIEKEALRMGGLVEDLLQLARLDETREFERAIVDLEPIAEDAAMDARAQSPNRPVSVAPTRVIPLGDASGGAEAGTTAVTGRTGGAGAGTGGAAGTGIATGTGANVGHGSNDDGEARAAIVAAGGTTYLGAPVPGQSGSPAAAPDARDPDARGAEASSADAVGSDAAGADADAGDPSGAAPTARPRRRWRPRTPTIPRVSRQQLGRLLGRRGAAAEIARVAADDGRVAGGRIQVGGEIDDDDLDIPAMVLGNENKMRQAVSNIVGNAMRYTPDDSPLEVGVVLDVPARTATVEIVDHGDGVPAEIRQKIFERFWRADTSRARETGGSGLGLAIVMAIMRAHEGTVEVVETPGGGATFRLAFPLLVADEDVDEAPSTGDGSDEAASSGAA